MEIDRSRRMRPYLIGGIILLVLLGAALFPYIVMPYDTLFGTISSKLNL
jgi:hypothetical protein